MGRRALVDIVREATIDNKKPFYGRLSQFEIEIMDCPNALLDNYKDRGRVMLQRSSPKLSKDESIHNSLIGFTLIANAHASGKGIIGQLQTEMWYSKAYTNTRKDGTVHSSTNNYGGRNIRCLATKPIVYTRSEQKIAFSQTARPIG